MRPSGEPFNGVFSRLFGRGSLYGCQRRRERRLPLPLCRLVGRDATLCRALPSLPARALVACRTAPRSGCSPASCRLGPATGFRRSFPLRAALGSALPKSIKSILCRRLTRKPRHRIDFAKAYLQFLWRNQNCVDVWRENLDTKLISLRMTCGFVYKADFVSKFPMRAVEATLT